MASLAGGVALGGYTIGGYRMSSPASAADFASFSGQPSSADAMARETQVATIIHDPKVHVCQGCDARIHPEYDEESYVLDASYPGVDLYPEDYGYSLEGMDYDDVRITVVDLKTGKPVEGIKPDQEQVGRAKDMAAQAEIMAAHGISLPKVGPAPQALASQQSAPPPQSVAVAAGTQPVNYSVQQTERSAKLLQ